MTDTFQIDGEAVTLYKQLSDTGFRLTIIPAPTATPALANLLWERATTWTRARNAADDTAAIHCFRDMGQTVIQAPKWQPSDTAWDELRATLRGAEFGVLAGAAAGTQPTAWPLRRHNLPVEDQAQKSAALLPATG